MSRSFLLLVAVWVSALALGLTACGNEADEADEPAADAPAESVGATGAGGDAATEDSAEQARKERAQAPRPAGVRLEAADSQFGTVIWGPNERAVYIFDLETSSRSECYGDCAIEWPPVLTKGAPRAGNGVDGSRLGTTERRDGSTQVTYDGQPLYYYVDEPRGQILCHNVEGFGGLWLVIRPDGQPVA